MNQEHQENASLDRLLREWVVDEPLPPRFEEQVWHRIRQTEVDSQASIWSWLFCLIEVILPRPKVAYSYFSLLLVMGIAIGVWEAQKQNSQLEASLGSRYLQSVDPFQVAPPK
jgi:hypothetical protein